MSAFELALLGFWTAWFAIVTLTNAFGALKACGRLPADWRFASRNYEAIAKAVGKYEPPGWLPGVLFAGVVVWQAAATALFARAFATADPAAADLALYAGIALWGAFMLADEITLEYEFERTHELLFVAQLATLVALHVLPGRAP